MQKSRALLRSTCRCGFRTCVRGAEARFYRHCTAESQLRQKIGPQNWEWGRAKAPPPPVDPQLLLVLFLVLFLVFKFSLPWLLMIYGRSAPRPFWRDSEENIITVLYISWFSQFSIRFHPRYLCGSLEFNHILHIPKRWHKTRKYIRNIQYSSIWLDMGIFYFISQHRRIYFNRTTNVVIKDVDCNNRIV